MRERWDKIRKMRQSESTVKTPPPSTTTTTTTKRFHFNVFVNQVMKIFASPNHIQEEKPTPKNFFALPSISVTTPEGQTTVVE